MFKKGERPPVMRFKRAETMYDLDLDVEGPLQGNLEAAADEW